MLTFTCPKCGLDNQSAIRALYEPDTDRLHCICGRCRAEWYESPADQRLATSGSNNILSEAFQKIHQYRQSETVQADLPHFLRHLIDGPPMPGPIATLDAEQSEKLMEWLGIPVCAECGTRHP